MLTVNHQVDGRETIYQARLAEYKGPLAVQDPKRDFVDGQHMMLQDDEYITILRGGRIYVMNHEGRTIATYVLEHGDTAPRPDDWSPAVVLRS